MTTTPNIPLTDDEITHLEALLASPIFSKQAMGLDEIQGFLCAVISGPVLVTPSQWMPAILGNPKYETAAQATEVTNFLMRFYNEIVADLVAGEALGMLLHRDDGAAEDDFDYETWCLAYLDGVEFSPVPWDEAGEEEEINELLFPISLLAGEIEPKALKQIKPRDMADLMIECREDLPLLTVDIYKYFLSLRTRPPLGKMAAEKKPPKKLH